MHLVPKTPTTKGPPNSSPATSATTLLPQVPHRLGARPTDFMAHLAMWDSLADGQDGPETEWGDHLGDGGYPAGE